MIQHINNLLSKNLSQQEQLLDACAKYLLVIAATLMFCMALVSGFNSHPDESLHFESGNYYIENWIVPRVGEVEEIYLSTPYGTSYLDIPNISYLFAGKFVALSSMVFAGPLYVQFRLFNVGLFIGLTIFLFIINKWKIGISHYLLLVSPQLWYLFSYFNNDVFPFVLSMALSGYWFGKNQKLHSNKYILLLTGAIMGLLIISKPNFYAFGLFFGLIYLTKFYYDPKHWQKHFNSGLFIICGVIMTAGSYLLIDYSINGVNKLEQLNVVREIYAEEAYKPSNQKSFRDLGIPLYELFTRFKWGFNIFRSSFGVYGYMNVFSPFYVYLTFAVSTLVTFFTTLYLALVNFKKFRQRFLIWVITCVGISTNLFAAIWFAWDYEFQAQGKYLIPFIPIILGALLILKPKIEHLNALKLVLLLNGLVGVYSFLFSGLFLIPKS